jgi:hypothetical protein
MLSARSRRHEPVGGVGSDFLRGGNGRDGSDSPFCQLKKRKKSGCEVWLFVCVLLFVCRPSTVPSLGASCLVVFAQCLAFSWYFRFDVVNASRGMTARACDALKGACFLLFSFNRQEVLVKDEMESVGE